jgi:hypothetical protein
MSIPADDHFKNWECVEENFHTLHLTWKLNTPPTKKDLKNVGYNAFYYDTRVQEVCIILTKASHILQISKECLKGIDPEAKMKDEIRSAVSQAGLTAPPVEDIQWDDGGVVEVKCPDDFDSFQGKDSIGSTVMGNLSTTYNTTIQNINIPTVPIEIPPTISENNSGGKISNSTIQEIINLDKREFEKFLHQKQSIVQQIEKIEFHRKTLRQFQYLASKSADTL